MRRSTLSIMCLIAMFCIGLAAPLAIADKDRHKDQDKDERLSVSVAFGRGLNTAQAGNIVNHVILPKKIKIEQGGVVHFLVAGFHQLMVYKPGTKPEDIRAFIGNSTDLFINDPNDLFYQGINPAGGPLETPATPIITSDPTIPDDTRSNASNRVESMSFPASAGTGTPSSEKAEPGVYLVICNVRGHFLDGMFGFVKVKAVKAEDEDEDEDD